LAALSIPDPPAKAGQPLEYRYRLTWGTIEEPITRLARVASLRSGAGGVSGAENDGGLRKFVVDFAGEALRNISQESDVGAKVSVTNGDIAHMAVSPVKANGHWRVVIDLKPKSDRPV